MSSTVRRAASTVVVASIISYGVCHEGQAGSVFAAILPPEQSGLSHTHVQFQWLEIDRVDLDSYQLWIVEDTGNEDPFDGVPSVANMLVTPDKPTVIVKSGLEFGKAYAWRVRGFSQSGDPSPWGATHRFFTRPLPDYLPDIDITLGPSQHPLEPGLTMFDIQLAGELNIGLGVAVDHAGNYVWFSEGERLTDVRLLPNGRVMFLATAGERRAFETTLNGRLLWTSPTHWTEYPFDEIHHEIFPMPNGNFLTLGTEFGVVFNNDEYQFWRGDLLLEFDRATTAVVNQWSTFDHYSTLDFDPTIMAGPWQGGDYYDWTHANAVIYNEADNSVYLSNRHLSRITRIDYDTGEIIYNMGFDMPSGETDFGDNLFSFQHAVQMLPNGNMMVYDNGNRRDHVDQTPETGITKAIELAFDGDPPTSASIVWEYTLPGYAAFVGDADRLPGGNTLVVEGPSVKIYEVDHDAVEAWTLELAATTIPPFIIYRAERIPELVIENTLPHDLVDPLGVGIEDLLWVLQNWGSMGVDADFVPPAGVGVEDFLLILAAWGSMPDGQ